MKIFGKKKASQSAKSLEKELGQLRAKHSQELREITSMYELRMCNLRAGLEAERQQGRRAVEAANHYAELVKQRDQTIAIAGASIEIERVELQARADRATMRLKGLGV